MATLPVLDLADLLQGSLDLLAQMLGASPLVGGRGTLSLSVSPSSDSFALRHRVRKTSPQKLPRPAGATRGSGKGAMLREGVLK